MATLKIKQVRSKINRPSRQKKTLAALGLRKMNQTVERPDNEAIRGMVSRVAHLVEVQES